MDLTIPAGEADGTGASVVFASVEAGCSVVTGTIVGAEVEILVAHLTSPSLLALTSPGLGTCAVDTARIDLALIAGSTLPALVTAENRRNC